MVDMTDTENRQIETLKRLWKRFGNTILWIVVILVAAFAIWTYWQKEKDGKLVEASQKYLQLQNDLQSGLKADTIIKEANALMQAYPNTIYAQFSGLLVANEYVDQKMYKEAQTNLDWVISNSDDKAVRAVATLRLARIKIAMGQADNAIMLIDQADLPQSYQVLGQLIKSQGYIQLADKDKAQMSLQKAKQLLIASDSLDDPANNELIQQSENYIDMQLSNLDLLIANATAHTVK